ncbi:GPP34 family phosphoprotein [Plantactinospora sp. CA-290183]|uniref:GPP34 family phosphoprotein n=1 Tax=Plantactinospora sp. CA-290183 TaxID=3240006 RepID=UPI003D909104
MIWRPRQPAYRTNPHLPLADDLYLIALDERTGRYRRPERAVRLALAAALLGELVLAGRLDIRGRRLVVVQQRTRPADPLAATVEHRILAEPGAVPVAGWLDYLAQEYPDKIVSRLRDRGWIIPAVTRRLWSRTVVARPASRDRATDIAWRAPRIANALTGQGVCGWEELLLARLMMILDLLAPVVYDGQIRKAERHVEERIREALPLWALTAVTKAAVDQITLSHRR